MPSSKDSPGKMTANQDFLSTLKSHCIAITGAIATGKTTVADIIRSHGFRVIDADLLAREAVLPGTSALEEIVGRFGRQVLDADGSLNRSELRSMVMTDENKRKALESIMHPAIQKKFADIVQNEKLGASGPFFYEAALIFEVGRDPLFKEVWSTVCPEAVQLDRLCNRSGLSNAAAQQLINSQWPAPAKASKARRVVDTNRPLELVRVQVEDLIKTLTT